MSVNVSALPLQSCGCGLLVTCKAAREDADGNGGTAYYSCYRCKRGWQVRFVREAVTSYRYRLLSETGETWTENMKR